LKVDEAAAKTQNQIYFNGQLLATHDQDDYVRLLFKDHLDSTRSVATVTPLPGWQWGYEGETTAVFSYNPYGDYASSWIWDSQIPKVRFTGKERESNGLDYFGARYYESTRTHRWMSADSLTARIYDPLSLNKYSYVRNDPVNRIDPDGRAWMRMCMDTPDLRVTSEGTYYSMGWVTTCGDEEFDIGGSGPDNNRDPEPVPNSSSQSLGTDCIQQFNDFLSWLKESKQSGKLKISDNAIAALDSYMSHINDITIHNGAWAHTMLWLTGDPNALGAVPLFWPNDVYLNLDNIRAFAPKYNKTFEEMYPTVVVHELTHSGIFRLGLKLNSDQREDLANEVTVLYNAYRTDKQVKPCNPDK